MFQRFVTYVSCLVESNFFPVLTTDKILIAAY